MKSKKQKRKKIERDIVYSVCIGGREREREREV